MNDITLPEVKNLFKDLSENPGSFFDLLRVDVKACCEHAVTELIKCELSSFLGREKYERLPRKDVNRADVSPVESSSAMDESVEAKEVLSNQINYRNGYYTRSFTVKGLGELNLSIPRDRLGEFQSSLVGKYERMESSLKGDLGLLFLAGLSTRNIAMISKRLIGRRISSSEVSRVSEELQTGIEQWRTRDLSNLKIKYMFIDGVFFDMRVKDVSQESEVEDSGEGEPSGGGTKNVEQVAIVSKESLKARRVESIEKVPMLIVVGVTESNQRLFLSIQQGDKDSATTWREIFRDLKKRGLNHTVVQLGIMDGLSGLEKVFKEEFQEAKVQRCQVHVSRNVLCKVPKSIKQTVSDRLRDIFYAPDKNKARKRYRDFLEDFADSIPTAVNSLRYSIESCLTFYDFPQEEWNSLRTTNLIERVNKEFKRRTKPMEILAGEKSAYRLLSFIAIKLELHWRSARFGKKKINAIDEFTQNT